MSDHESNDEASRLTQLAFEDRQYLKHQCELNGNAILKRWRKKSPDERRALLLQVDPKMYPHQWCDAHFELDFHDTEWKNYWDSLKGQRDFEATKGKERRRYRNVCLAPYINQGGLIKDPSRFLSLLYNRTKYTPEEWAPYDSFIIAKPWDMGSFATTYNRNCISFAGANYGQLIPWDNVDAHGWMSIGFPRGILILEAQQRVMSILRGVVTVLLDGSLRVETNPQSTNFTSALVNGLKRYNTKSLPTSLHPSI